MLEIRRRGPGAIRRLQYLSARHPPRRLAHDDHHHATPQSESFGKGFYFVLALIPSSYLLYTLSRPSSASDPHPLTRLLSVYSDYRTTWEERNTLHTKAVEAAARDRNLFLNTPMPNHIELRFPEQFNTGSPFNVSAGQGGGNLEKVIAHYRAKSFAEEESEMRRMTEKNNGQ